MIFFQTASRTRRLEKYCLYCYTSRQIHCKLGQKNLRIKSEIYYRLFAPTYSVFIVKCNNINNIFPNGVCATPFGKKSFFCNILRQLHCKLKQKTNKISRKFPTYFVSVFCSNFKCILLHINIGNFRYISKISDLFCQHFLSQLREHFVVFITEISDIYGKFTIYFVGFFVPTLECILSYIYISDKFYCK